MCDSLGARLRRHREDRGVSIVEVAEQTKIKLSLLDGLERDDISQWPAGIFRRAYVRAYAAAIHFDPDTALREFLALHPDPIEIPEPVSPPPGGLRGLFGSLRRRSPAPIVSTPALHAPAPPTARVPVPLPEAVTATIGKHEPDPPPAAQPAAPDAGGPTADFLAAARICTELGRVDDIGQVPPLLGEAATILGARGLIVWVWDGAAELTPALVHGYPAKVRARLRGVGASADNVTAAAYRAGAPLATSGALAVPLLTPGACAGVLAIEVENGREQHPDLRALATFFAAMLAQLVGAPAAAEARDEDHPQPQAIAAPPG